VALLNFAQYYLISNFSKDLHPSNKKEKKIIEKQRLPNG
jgi:hypothetical protein